MPLPPTYKFRSIPALIGLYTKFGSDLPFQSGTFESKSRHVSKRGSPHLRRTLFIISSVILQLSHEDNPVFCFMDKKRSQGKHFYVYMVAGAAKFLRIYYATVTGHFKVSEHIDSLPQIAG